MNKLNILYNSFLRRNKNFITQLSANGLFPSFNNFKQEIIKRKKKDEYDAILANKNASERRNQIQQFFQKNQHLATETQLQKQYQILKSRLTTLKSNERKLPKQLKQQFIKDNYKTLVSLDNQKPKNQRMKMAQKKALKAQLTLQADTYVDNVITSVRPKSNNLDKDIYTQSDIAGLAEIATKDAKNREKNSGTYTRAMNSNSLLYKIYPPRDESLDLTDMSNEDDLLQQYTYVENFWKQIEKTARPILAKALKKSIKRLDGKQMKLLKDLQAKKDSKSKLSTNQQYAYDELSKPMEQRQNIKFGIQVVAKWKKSFINEAGVPEFEFAEHFSPNVQSFVCFNETDIDRKLEENYIVWKQYFDTQNERKDSNWVLVECLYAKLTINKFSPYTTGTWVETPFLIAKTHCCININNSKSMIDECVALSIWCGVLQIKKDPQRITKYIDYMNGSKDHEGFKLNMDNIAKPILVKDYDLIEKQNPDLAINLYTLLNSTRSTKGELAPCRISSHQSRKYVISLLMIDDSHVLLIKNFNGLMRSFDKGSTHCATYCQKCCTFKAYDDVNGEKMQEHLKLDCDGQKTKMPKDDEAFMKFKNFKNKLEVPGFIVADCESYFESMKAASDKFEDMNRGKNRKKIKNSAKREFVAKHVLNSISVKYKCPYDDQLSEPRKQFHGPNAVKDMLDYANKKYDEIEKILKYKQSEMKLTPEQQIDFRDACRNPSKHICHICNRPLSEFTFASDKKHRQIDRDHDHLKSGYNYRGATHHGCNLRFNYKDFKLPILFHNLKGYDSKFIVQEASTEYKITSVIAQTSENFSTFTINNKLKFIDSIQFFNCSLDSLVDSLTDEGKDLSTLKETRKHFSHLTDDQFKLIAKKGIFPYEWFDSPEKLKQPFLPPQNAFDNKLTRSKCGDKQYQHEQDIWKTFDMKSFQDYHDLYLDRDVFLLTDVILANRDLLYKEYKLDMMWYQGLPGFALDAMLLSTGVTIPLFKSDQKDMYNFVEKVRGGISTVSHRYARANNKTLGEHNYDPNQPESYIIPFDENAQYAHSMSQCLPLGNFEWIKPTTDQVANVMNTPDDSEVGYLLEADSYCPKELHDEQSEYPFLPQRYEPKHEELSEYYHKVRSVNDPSYNKNKPAKLNETLICNFHPKTKYVMYYRNAKQAVAHGHIITKVHRILKFSQSKWMKPYIDLNTNLRKKALFEWQKDVFKLMSNAVYGKMLENVRKYKKFDVASEEKQFNKLVRDPYFARSFQLKQQCKKHIGIVGIERTQKCITFNKPIIVGFVILEISKTSMYKFHYDVIKRLFPNDQSKLLYTDTDSLYYHLFTDDLISKLKEIKHLLDCSDYPRDHPLFDDFYKKVHGQWKDDSKGVPILEFRGSRSKQYVLVFDLSNYIVQDGEQKPKDIKIKAKGIPRAFAKQLTVEDFKNTLETGKSKLLQNILSFRSFDQTLYTMESCKVALSACDTKRYILPNGISSLPYGHYRIPVIENYSKVLHELKSFQQ